jgi:large subunit ribosomal protein L34e
MPQPSKRTRSVKRHDLRLPGGRFETHYKREKPDVSRCSRCGRELSGIPRLIPSELRKLSASQRGIERIYGGQLCHGCLRDLLKQTVRSTYTP